MTQDIITRKEAKDRGLKRYFTGKPCKHGHIAERHTVDGACTECSKSKNKKRLINNPEKRRIYARRNYEKHKEAIKLRVKKWRRNNPELKRAMDIKWNQSHPEYKSDYYKKNVNAIREKNQRWKRDNREHHLNSVAKWRRENPEKRAVFNRRYRHRVRGAEGTYSKEDIDKLFIVQNGKCLVCGAEFSASVPYTIDHNVPISRGGTNWPNNLSLMCRPCNSSKGCRTLLEFLCEDVDALAP